MRERASTAAFITIWLAALGATIGFWAVVIWAIVKLVNHYT
jgi:hypothetical protein